VSEHDQILELIEAYALGALEQQESATVAAHLASGCPECTKALEEARWLVTQLVYLAPSAEPSASLRSRVLQQAKSEAGPARVTEMRSSSPTKSAIPVWMWAGVAAMLLLTMYSTWNAKRTNDKNAEINAQLARALWERGALQEQLTAARHEAVILTDPGSKKFTIWPNDKQMPRLEAAWHQNMGIYVSGQKVPMPGKNHVLQLWLISKSGKPMPSRTFWPDSSGKVDLMIDDPPEVLAQTKALAVTEEPMGGSPQPTTTPMWVGGVS
jgi:anti-sigma-K factor RskA